MAVQEILDGFGNESSRDAQNVLISWYDINQHYGLFNRIFWFIVSVAIWGSPSIVKVQHQNLSSFSQKKIMVKVEQGYS